MNLKKPKVFYFDDHKCFNKKKLKKLKKMKYKLEKLSEINKNNVSYYIIIHKSFYIPSDIYERDFIGKILNINNPEKISDNKLNKLHKKKYYKQHYNYIKFDFDIENVQILMTIELANLISDEELNKKINDAKKEKASTIIIDNRIINLLIKKIEKHIELKKCIKKIK